MNQEPAQGLVEPKPGHIDENYAYWREHGSSWVQEYAQRKLHQAYYHIQEVMLADYVQQSALIARTTQGERPLRVLEFGCGVGRHLANLSRLAGVDVHGYDQSAAMVAGCLHWTGQDWINQHVRVGEPVGQLPYADNSFDIVYTSEVLIHVRPEHLSRILAELLRVAKWQVLHFEPAEHTQITSDSHDGCWRHDLPASYAGLGESCETLPSGFRVQAPYRVMLGDPAPFTWSPVLLDMFRRMDRDIEAGFAAMRGQALSLEAANKDLQTKLADSVRAQDHARQATANADLARELSQQLSDMVSQRLAAERTEQGRAREALGAADRVDAERLEAMRMQCEDAKRELGVAKGELAALAHAHAQAEARASSLAGEVSRLCAERRATVRELQRLLHPNTGNPEAS